MLKKLFAVLFVMISFQTALIGMEEKQITIHVFNKCSQTIFITLFHTINARGCPRIHEYGHEVPPMYFENITLTLMERSHSIRSCIAFSPDGAQKVCIKELSKPYQDVNIFLQPYTVTFPHELNFVRCMVLSHFPDMDKIKLILMGDSPFSCLPKEVKLFILLASYSPTILEEYGIPL